MIRALVPVISVLALAVVAGILLAQGGLFINPDLEPASFSEVSTGSTCCSKAHAQESQVSLASQESGACDLESACKGGQCPSSATLASLNTDGDDEESSSACCPSVDTPCCAESDVCCSDKEICCSEEKGCCSEEAGEAPLEPNDAVAAVAE